MPKVAVRSKCYHLLIILGANLIQFIMNKLYTSLKGIEHPQHKTISTKWILEVDILVGFVVIKVSLMDNASI